MKKLFHDYGILQETISVFYDNISAINIFKNPVQHLKSKHIEICYYFIYDLVEDKIVCLEFIHTANQKIDIGVGIIPWISCVLCVLHINLKLVLIE